MGSTAVIDPKQTSHSDLCDVVLRLFNQVGSAMGSSQCAFLEGFPVLARLDRIDLPIPRLLIALITISLIVFAILFFALNTIVGYYAKPMGIGDFIGWMVIAASVGVNLAIAVAAARYLENTLRTSLSSLITSFQVSTPTIRFHVFAAVFASVLWVLNLWTLGLYVTHISWIKAVILVLPALFSFLAGSLLFTAIGSSVSNYLTVSKKVSIKLHRIDNYACFAMPLIVIVGLFSVVFSLLGVLSISVETKAILTTVLLLLLSLLIFFSGIACLPIFAMFKRLRYHINNERERVLSVLDNVESRLPDGDAYRNETVINMYVVLAYLNNLSPWPISSHLKKLILFLVFPPLTWTLAATVEYLLF